METWTFRSIEPKKCPVLMFSLMHGLTHDQTDLKVITFLYLYWYNDLQISYKIYLTNIARQSVSLLPWTIYQVYSWASVELSLFTCFCCIQLRATDSNNLKINVRQPLIWVTCSTLLQWPTFPIVTIVGFHAMMPGVSLLFHN